MTSCEVGATCTDCAVFADVYQDTTRCDVLAPTPRLMVDDVAGACAPAVIEPMPIAENIRAEQGGFDIRRVGHHHERQERPCEVRRREGQHESEPEAEDHPEAEEHLERAQRRYDDVAVDPRQRARHQVGHR